MMSEQHVVIQSIYDALIKNKEFLFAKDSEAQEKRNELYQHNQSFNPNSRDYALHSSYLENVLNHLFLKEPSNRLRSTHCLFSSFFYVDYFSSYLFLKESITDEIASELLDERKRTSQIIRLSDAFHISNTNVNTARYSMIERTKDLIVEIKSVFQTIES